MARSVRLRAWQKAALEKFVASPDPDFMAVATPGAGKTTFALTAARHHLAAAPHARVIVVVPTQHLKTQWAGAALGFALHLEPEWAASRGALPADMHGIVTTYQQVATNASVLAGLSTDAFVVFDEVHHAGDDRAWGDSIRAAFTPAGRRLALSGTPFRSDTQAIPFVRYDDDEAVPDFEYGYADALAGGGVVRPVYFPRIDGEMEWVGTDGAFHTAGFTDELNPVLAGQRLRTALSVEGQWLPEVLGHAHRRLKEIRATHPEAAGLVIAMDQDHARGIGELLERRFNVRPTIATSDDPMASMRIARFASGSEPWIVAVRMVSEGVDIPRLRVGVFATNTTTDLFFRQAIGRLVRYTKGTRNQKSYMFIPDDPRLRVKAIEVAAQRRHSLRRRRSETYEEHQSFDDVSAAVGDDRQPSMFTAISSVALTQATDPAWVVEGDDDDGSGGDDEVTIDLAPPPPLAGGEAAPDGVTRARRKSDLRLDNAERAKELVALTGMTHAAVNGELNRLAGVRRITEATVQQLETRLGHADRWISRLTRPV